VNDRAWAATAIAHLIQNPESRMSLMEAKVVPHLIANLQDASERVVLESLGALRNTLVSVGQDACIEAIENGSVELLLQLLSRFVLLVQQQETVDEERPDTHVLLEQTIACLWSLSEYSERALKLVTSSDMLNLVMQLYTNDNAPLPLRKISGQFLNTITDENNDIYPLFLNQSHFSKQLLEMLQDSTLHTWEEAKIELSILAGSILNNIKIIYDEKDQGEMYGQIVRIVGECLNYDLSGLTLSAQEAGSSADQSMNSITPNELTLNMEDLDLLVPKNKNTESLSNAISHLNILQLTLELLANMFSEDTPQWEDSTESEENDDMEVLEGTEPENDAIRRFSGMLFEGVHPVFSSLARICIQPLVRLEPTACQNFNVQMEQVQIRALACTTNLFLLGLVDTWIQKEDEIRGFWEKVFECAVLATNVTPIPLELFEALISLLFSIAKAIQGRISIVQDSDVGSNKTSN
jgi:hypothetical protein